MQAYCYAGENLLAQEKCGEAIRALQESHKCECVPVANKCIPIRLTELGATECAAQLELCRELMSLEGALHTMCLPTLFARLR